MSVSYHESMVTGEPRNITHHLREVRDLCGYRIVGASRPLGTLSGLVFDPVTWKVGRFVVYRGDMQRDRVMVPVQRFRSIDDGRRELLVEAPDATLDSAEPYRPERLAGARLIDTSSLIGKTLDGRDGPVGTISDLLVNVDVWTLRYLIVESGSKRALTDIEWCSSLNDGKRPCIDLPAEAIATAPPYQARYRSAPDPMY